MSGHSGISELLVQTGAYRDLDKPVILTSGQLGIFYINTEKLVQDDGEWKLYSEDSKAMIRHAVGMMHKKPTFRKVIEILKKRVVTLLRNSPPCDGHAISGGQRRDWLFSGPVAAQLNLPHISVYKDGRVEVIPACGGLEDLGDVVDLHISDLLTEGSSCYRIEDGEEKGWVSEVRRIGAKINDLICVVTRLQGGEERLSEQKVTVHPFVTIDEAFLGQYSNEPERALAYHKDPTAWSESYLRENGALALVSAFDPKGGKLDRAKKFWDRYGTIIMESGKYEEFDSALREKYGQSLGELVGGD